MLQALFALLPLAIISGLCWSLLNTQKSQDGVSVANLFDIWRCIVIGYRIGLKEALWALEEQFPGNFLICLKVPFVGKVFLCLGHAGSVFFHKMEFDHLKTYRRFLGDAMPKSILDNLDDRMRAVKKGTSTERFPELVDITRHVIQDFFDELPDSGQLDLFQTISDLVYFMELATFVGPELCGAKRRRFIQLFRQVDIEGLTQNPIRIIFGKLSGKHLEPIFSELRELVKEIVTGWDENRSRENANFLEVVVRECTKDGVVDWDAVFWDVYTMVVAGQANTYVTAGWLLFYYETNSHVRTKILAELSVISSFGEPHEMISQFNRMIYTEQSIREIVRLSMSFIEFRSTPRDMTFENDAYIFQIPKDSLIVFAPITLHMRNDIFPEARKFAPERHKLNKDGRLESTMVRDCKLTVWGCGRHPCPGLKLANLQMKMILWYMTTYLDYTIENKESPKTTPMLGVHRPTFPVMVKYRKRNLSSDLPC